MAPRKPDTAPATVRVVPIPGLRLDPIDATPEEAAALVATGSYQYEAAPAAVTAESEASDGAV